jgi:hypothetical protein
LRASILDQHLSQLPALSLRLNGVRWPEKKRDLAYFALSTLRERNFRTQLLFPELVVEVIHVAFESAVIV